MLLLSSSSLYNSSSGSCSCSCPNPNPNHLATFRNNSSSNSKRKISNRLILLRRANAIQSLSEAAAAAAPPPADISWQIVVGSIAGITPFIVAGIEFSKRIIAQRKCEVCQGSGLVLRAGVYIRCTNCGGFLPWQSWKRFFTG